jgi:hypothetical protein
MYISKNIYNLTRDQCGIILDKHKHLQLIKPQPNIKFVNHLAPILERYNSLHDGNIHGYQATIRSAIF